MDSIPKIEHGYTDNNGEYFANIENVTFVREQDIFAYLGEQVAQSNGNKSIIFTSNQRPNIAYKMNPLAISYQQDLNYQKFFCTMDINPSMISKLISKQHQVKETLFPTGIISIDNYPIAQIIPYFKDSITLKNALEHQENLFYH